MELFETLLFALFCLLRRYVCFELFNLELGTCECERPRNLALRKEFRHRHLLFSGLYGVATNFIRKIRKLYKILQDCLE